MRTPLHEACCNGHVKVAELLFQGNADINTQDRWEGVCKQVATAQCFFGLRTVYNRFGKHFHSFSGGDTPIHWAVCNGHHRCAKVLMECGALLSIANGNLLIVSSDISEINLHFHSKWTLFMCSGRWNTFACRIDQ